MKRKIFIMLLALALTLLCGCGASGGDGDASVCSKGIFYTRAATDAEAFSQVLDLQNEDEIDLEDGEVPLSAQPGETAEESWALVRCTRNEDGTWDPVWYRVWTEDGVWSQENLPYEGGDWNPALSAPAAEEEVRPLG